jgi:hypothetical protein
MHRMRSGESREMRARRWWPVAVLAGLGLVMAVAMASASTAAPQANEFHRKQLSNPSEFAAYPDMAVGDGGLVVAVWTEGEAGSDQKHVGPLQLGWVSDSTDGWQTKTVDPGDVYDAAVAVSGSTVHVVWSLGKTLVLYTSCHPPDYDCDNPEMVATASKEALQVDIALEGNGTPHVVWVEDDNRVYYTRKTGATWNSKGAVDNSTESDFPAIAFANDFIHVVWAEWQDGPTARYTEVYYCKQPSTGGGWSCVTPLAQWEEHPARNLSVATDQNDNVYVVWDFLKDNPSENKLHYIIGYKHYDGESKSWQDTRTYPQGSAFGTNAQVFESGEGQQRDEYIRFLRPHVSLAASGTLTVPVPVLAWHARVSTGGEEPELAQPSADKAYKVLWTYATQPGSDEDGYMFWTSDYITLSTDLCGAVDMNVDSATAGLAVVGDLNNVKHGGNPDGSDHLHAVYHEETGASVWGVFYNSNVPVACFHVYLPLILKNASGGGGGD